MVMIEAILCVESLSLSYTIATCYGIDECITSCWCMGVSKYKDSTLHIQAERTHIQWRQPSLGCCFHEDYNIMAFRICINRFWLVGGKAIIPIVFPFYTWIVGANPLPWMPITTETKYCTASMRSAWVAPTSPNKLFESWTDTLQKNLWSWYIPFALQVWYHIRANEIVHAYQLKALGKEVLAWKLDVQDPSPLFTICGPFY